MRKKLKKLGDFFGWILLGAVILCVYLFKLRKVPSTVIKLLQTDSKGRAFVIFFTVIVLLAVYASKLIEKKRIRSRTERLNGGTAAETEEIRRKNEARIQKTGCDKKLGSTIKEDLTHRYRKRAAFPIFLTIVFVLLGIYGFIIKSDTQVFVCCLYLALIAFIYAAFRLRAEPVTQLLKIWNVTARLPAVNEDYMNGRLICRRASGINVGRLFVVCFNSENAFIIPTGDIESTERCILYKSENNRGFLGIDKVEYILVISLKKPYPVCNSGFTDRIAVKLDRYRLEMAFDALREINVPAEYEYKYIEK